MLVPGTGAGYTPMDEMKTLLDGVVEEKGREVSDPLAVTTPVLDEEERSVSTTSLSAQPGSTGTGSSFGSLSTLLAASTPSRY